MSDNAEGTTKGVGLFSALESATETTHFLLALTFVLLVDSMLVYFNHAGVIDLIRKPELIHPSLGLEVILIFVGFSFLTSIALPVLAVIVDGIVIHTVGYAWATLDLYLDKKFGNTSRYVRVRKRDCVNPLELRREAHEKKDSYLLGLYKDYEERWRKNRRSILKHALYAFYALSMVFLNYFLIGSISDKSLLTVIAQYFNSSAYIWWTEGALLSIVYVRMFRSEDSEWIYCPTLFRELDERDKKKRLDVV
jgi:hypothetical protein